MAETQVIVVDPKAQAQKQLVDELEKLKANPLDRAPEGGYFLSDDGRSAHDAHGNKVDIRPEDQEQARKIRAMRPGGAQAEAEAQAGDAAPAPKKAAKKNASKKKGAKK